MISTASAHATPAAAATPRLAERERRGDERDHQRVVVTAAGEVQRDERVPADESRGEAPGVARRARSSQTTQRAAPVRKTMLQAPATSSARPASRASENAGPYAEVACR